MSCHSVYEDNPWYDHLPGLHSYVLRVILLFIDVTDHDECQCILFYH